MKMKTIKVQLIESIEAKGGKHVADTTLWNAHNADMTNSRSNVAKLISTLPKQNGFKYIAVVGKMGRSQHSASDVHVFKIPAHGVISTAETLFRIYEVF